MPTYEYKCPTCSFVNSLYMKIGNEVPVSCIGCFKDGKEYIMQKQISKPAGIHFKGSGFYETDYKGK